MLENVRRKKFALRKDYYMRVGQKVDVHFTNHQSLYNMEILSCPCVTGGLWILRGPDGCKYSVDVFTYMKERDGTMEGENLQHTTNEVLQQ